MMAILIVEDEKKTRAYLSQGLSESGFSIETAETGAEGLRCCASQVYDLIVLDVMLPERDGWSVLEELRRMGNMTPVLFLTARDAVKDRVKGLELGADDYLLKPFAFSELLARVRSVLRRGALRPPEQLMVADIKVDMLRQRASRGERQLELTPKQFALLSLFARRAGEVLSRGLIAKLIWDMDIDSDTNVVDVAVRRLRAKVDDHCERKLIHTVRSVGYVMEERFEGNQP
jgi:two-component system copper resistance phosphate regulon response regulator CusR